MRSFCDVFNTDGSVDGEKLMNVLEQGNVNHPSHYNFGKIEVLDFILDKNLNFLLGNAVKYIARCELKNGGKNRIEDIEKAIFYLNKQIDVWRTEEERNGNCESDKTQC